MLEMKCMVKGGVQGVWYRNFAKKSANELGLFGEARNLASGDVEVIAQGEKEKLKVFLVHLKDGPELAKVEEIAVEWREPSKIFNDFSVIYSS